MLVNKHYHWTVAILGKHDLQFWHFNVDKDDCKHIIM